MTNSKSRCAAIATIEKFRRRIVSAKSVVQSYRVFARLECGHLVIFSLRYEAHRTGNWRRRRRECPHCQS